MRKLASVVVVDEVLPIDGADKIELIKIQGWQVVAQKGRFRQGDLALYLEIDSVPPDTELFNWLWNKPDQPKVPRPGNYRIKTIKLRGELSQGIMLTYDELSKYYQDLDVYWYPDSDLTSYLGITKYELPEDGTDHNGGQGKGYNPDRRGGWPAFIPKTDETRIQSCLGVLDELRGKPYYISLKYDGTSATYYIDPETKELHCCSRNHSVKEGDNKYWQMARKYNLEGWLRAHWALTGKQYAIQGEIIGPGIQKNPLALKGLELRVFNLFCITDQKYIDWDVAYTILEDIPTVQVIESGSSFNHTMESLLALAEGKYEGTSNEREGLVIRACPEMTSKRLQGRLSFKAISNTFLLKGGI